MTATQRTLELLRTNGFVAGIVERWIQGARRRVDLLGFIDIIAISGTATFAVQSCGQSFSEHHRKILDSPHLMDWLHGNARGLYLIGWRKLKHGKRALYRPRIRRYFLNPPMKGPHWEDLEEL